MKVVMLGKEFCGKTSLVERFLNERFSGENKYQSTIGAAYGARYNNDSGGWWPILLVQCLGRWVLGGRRLCWESGTLLEVRDMRAWPGCTTGQSVVIAPYCVIKSEWSNISWSRQLLTEINMQGSQGSRSLLRSQWWRVLGETQILDCRTEENGGKLQDLYLCDQDRSVEWKQ